MVASGQNVMVVPCFFDAPARVSLSWGLPPLAKCCTHLPAVAVDLELETARQRVHDRHADAVQAAGDLVALAAELAAGVQHREHDLGRRLALVVGVVVDRDAPAVVGDPAAAVGEQRHLDARAVTGHGLVDGVVDDLVDQVVQAGGAGGSDVHAGAFADRLEALEHRDVLGAVRHARDLTHCSADRRGKRALDRGGNREIRRSEHSKSVFVSVPDGTSRLAAPSRGFRAPDSAAGGEPMRTRTDATTPGPTIAVQRGSTSAVSRYRSSLAQIELSTATVSTPSRTETSDTCARDVGAHDVGPARLEVGVRVPAGSAQLGADRGQRVADNGTRLLPRVPQPLPRSGRRRRAAPGRARCPGAPRPRSSAGSVRRQVRDQRHRALVVELAEHVVEQQHRGAAR